MIIIIRSEEREGYIRLIESPDGVDVVSALEIVSSVLRGFKADSNYDWDEIEDYLITAFKFKAVSWAHSGERL